MNVLIVGSSGYATYYIDLFKTRTMENASLCAVVDPFADKSPHLDWMRSINLPVYQTLEEFYEKGEGADLVIICSPIQFHLSQCRTALKNGSAVLCEKPLCAEAEGARELQELQIETGIPLGVGFQWSFSNTMNKLKKDILGGVLGKPLIMKSFASMKRSNSYYEASSWKGRITDRQGNMIMDSIIMNASSHYLHNILFVLGSEMDTAAMPEKIHCSTYRARDIQSFDTCFLEGEFDNGCKLIFCASHVAEKDLHPSFSYIFEKAVVTFDGGADDDVTAVFSDGTVKKYGKPQSSDECYRKFFAMLEVLEGGGAPVCTVKTIMPHLLVCKAITEDITVSDFPDSAIIIEDSPPSLHAEGLLDAMEVFYKSGADPRSQGAAWGAEPVTISL